MACRRLGAEPYKYLKDVITELANGSRTAEELTPRKWLERERAPNVLIDSWAILL